MRAWRRLCSPSADPRQRLFVFDLVGGDTLQRSWQVIKLGGTLVSVVSPRPSFEEAKAHDIHAVWFVVEPNREQLIQIGKLIDAGKQGESYEQPCVLSHPSPRWPVHFLPGGRAGRRPSPAFASRPAILFADV